jgi:hypothetical protein
LHALDATAFLAQASKAAPSFLGFGAVGTLIDPTQEDAPEEQLWKLSTIGEQSVFFVHAAAGAVQALSMHWPQSVLPSVGGGGADDAVDSAVALGALDVSDVEADDEEVEGPAMSGAVDAPPAEAELSDAGLSGGLVSPPPHAIQAGSTATGRTRAVKRR